MLLLVSPLTARVNFPGIDITDELIEELLTAHKGMLPYYE
jgi:hypothetical protein